MAAIQALCELYIVDGMDGSKWERCSFTSLAPYHILVIVIAVIVSKVHVGGFFLQLNLVIGEWIDKIL